MREMLDAAKEIWLNIFWSDTWLVGALDAISLAKIVSWRGELSGRSALAWSAQDAVAASARRLARREELKPTVQYAESRQSAAGRQEWAQ
jgi:hypothetical protein